MKNFLKPSTGKFILPTISALLVVIFYYLQQNLLQQKPVSLQSKTLDDLLALLGAFTVLIPPMILYIIGFKSQFICYIVCIPVTFLGWALVLLSNAVFYYILSCLLAFLYRKARDHLANIRTKSTSY